MTRIEVSAHTYDNSRELADLVRRHQIGLDVVDENDIRGTRILTLEVVGRADAVRGFMDEFDRRHW